MKGKNKYRKSGGWDQLISVQCCQHLLHFCLLHISVDWFLYNGNTGLNCAVGAWSEKNYDLRLNVAKTLLSIIFKFSLISAQYLSLKAVFIDFMTSFVDIVNLLLYLSVVSCQKRKYFTSLLSLSCLTFKISSLTSCLAVAKVLT